MNSKRRRRRIRRVRGKRLALHLNDGSKRIALIQGNRTLVVVPTRLYREFGWELV